MTAYKKSINRIASQRWRRRAGAPDGDRFAYSEVVLQKVAERIDREGMFAEDGPVGVAVSGGPDSVALLHALRDVLGVRAFAVLHVNHCLRGSDSDSDEEFVRGLAASLDCKFHVRRCDLSPAAASGRGNLEQEGRRCRYRFFGEAVAAGTCVAVATGHTRSDQAETVLFRLLRGAAGAGLSGIWPVHERGVMRPMLDVTRAEVLEFLRRRGIPWREDASNASLDFARNRLRHRLLPELRRDWNPGVETALANTADWAVEEERYWRLRTADLRGGCVREEGGGLVLDIDAVRSLHVAEQRRLIGSVVGSPVLGARSADFGHIEAVRALVLARRGSGSVDLPGVRAERSFGAVLLRPRDAACRPDYDLPLPVPGRVRVPGGAETAVRTRLLAGSTPKPLYTDKGLDLLDWDRVPGPLRLRNWRAGDQYWPSGQGSTRKIRELFQRGRVKAWRRGEWPVVTSLDRIVWVRGVRSGGGFRSPAGLSAAAGRGRNERGGMMRGIAIASGCVLLSSWAMAAKDPRT